VGVNPLPVIISAKFIKNFSKNIFFNLIYPFHQYFVGSKLVFLK